MLNRINHTNYLELIPLNNATEATMADIVAQETLSPKEQVAFALVDWLNSTFTSQEDTNDGRYELLDAKEAINFVMTSAYHEFKGMAESQLSKQPTDNLNESERKRKIEARAKTIANEEILNIVNLYAQEIVRHAKLRNIVQVSRKDVLSFLLDYLHTSLQIRKEDRKIAHDTVGGVMNLIDKRVYVNNAVGNTDSIPEQRSETSEEEEFKFPDGYVNSFFEFFKSELADIRQQNQKMRKYGSLTWVAGKGWLSSDEIQEMKNAKDEPKSNPNTGEEG